MPSLKRLALCYSQQYVVAGTDDYRVHSFERHSMIERLGYLVSCMLVVQNLPLLNNGRGRFLKPLTLRAAKTGFTIFESFYLQTHFLENI